MSDLSIDIIYGRMDTAEAGERVKRIYKELEAISRDWVNFHPAPAFKITLDKAGQVHIKLNPPMLRHLLTRLSELKTMTLEVEPVDPPAWFMALMGNEPYEHLLPPDAIGS